MGYGDQKSDTLYILQAQRMAITTDSLVNCKMHPLVNSVICYICKKNYNYMQPLLHQQLYVLNLINLLDFNSYMCSFL
jgi:hypothetical protein